MLYYKPVSTKIMIFSTPLSSGDNFWKKYYDTYYDTTSFTWSVNACPHCEDEKINSRFEILDIR